MIVFICILMMRKDRGRKAREGKREEMVGGRERGGDGRRERKRRGW